MKFGHYFAADAWLWLRSLILVEILKLGLVKISEKCFAILNTVTFLNSMKEGSVQVSF